MLFLPQEELMRIAGPILFAILLSSPAFAGAKADSARAAVTYVAGDAVYLSVGRNAGVADSSLCYILDRKDTVAVLKVMATSSKSSVCAVVRSTRAIAVGDVVRLPYAAGEAPPPAAAPAGDSSALSARAPTPRAEAAVEPPPVAVHGRVNAQYFMNRHSGAGVNLARPGFVLNLRGSARDIPVTFELYGNFRSLSYGGGTLFGRGSVNQSRIYTLAVKYDDGATRLSAGRLTQAPIGSVGAVDGLLVSRRIENLTVGLSGGFEPLFSQRSFGSDFRKFSLFASYALPGSSSGSATAAYTRTYYHRLLDRDVLSGSVSFFPSEEWRITAQGDVDLHKKDGGALVASPDLTNFYSSLNYRLSPMVSLGAGVSAWRPTYAFSSVSAIPDSMLDYTLRTSPSASVSLALPAGISLYNTYSARSSSEGFGKEYSNHTSLSAGNIMNQGLSARGSLSFNTTLYAEMRGLGGALQKTLGGFLDVTARYQWYRYTYTRWGGVSTSKTAGVDLMFSLVPSVTFWGSVERLMSTEINTTSIWVDIGWRF